MEITLEQFKQIYREAIDPTARDGEGAEWWAAVAADVRAVLLAPSLTSAAQCIRWWHSEWEWQLIGDSAREAAGRLRDVAQHLKQA